MSTHDPFAVPPVASSETMARRIARELGIQPWQAANAIRLLDAQNTIPFIARYRKEQTGELNEDVLRRLAQRLASLRALEERRAEVWRLLHQQGHLDERLAQAIREADTLQRLEDLYLPYRPKRRTRASVAREKGLQPLADLVRTLQWPQGLAPSATAEDVAQAFVSAEAGVTTPQEALEGAADIVAEQVAEDAEVRELVRTLTRRHGRIVSRAVEVEGEREPTEFEMYYDFSEPLARIPPHRILALNRGERQEVLKVRIDVDPGVILSAITRRVLPSHPHPSARKALQPWLERAIEDGYKRLLAPSIERELRAELTQRAEEHAIGVFAANLRNLLLQPPVKPCTVLGIDPGYRTGCKVAVVSPTGDVLETATIYPHPPQKQWDEAVNVLLRLIETHRVRLLAIGNGTASRETERLAAQITRQRPGLHYLVVSEAGASVYSASPLAREELPHLDVSMRGAVSIARRTLDPLAELVKIDPKSIGVGLYQHDVNQKQLASSLKAVVESCVNYVGVELNTASPALLQYVSGINAATARAIVEYRRQLGGFTSRQQLLEVPRLGPKTFEQCAGFLRIQGAVDPLDQTAVHPESYPLARRILQLAGADTRDLAHAAGLEALQRKLSAREPAEWVQLLKAEGFEAGLPTVRDILDALARPGRDPREDLPPPLFREDILEMEDLKPGMVLQGTVSNVVDFGAFVDIGVKKAGLIHISQMGPGYVRHPMDVVSVGDVVTVRVLDVDLTRGRISLALA